MRVLGIDCGTERTGFGVIDTDGRRHGLVRYGVIRTSSSDPLCARLCVIAAQLRALIAEERPDGVAVEDVFHSVNARSALKLAHVRGVALFLVAEAGLTLGEYTPGMIKQSVVGHGRAEKAQVQLMVQSLLGLAERIASEDAADALAVAICHATRCNAPLAARRAGATR